MACDVVTWAALWETDWTYGSVTQSFQRIFVKFAIEILTKMYQDVS